MKKAALILVCLCAAIVASAQSLTVGSPAPALKPARWLKGEPVSQFAPGHVYVVEFWATWCGPCKANIPHLTALAEKYAGKVTVLGVNVWERAQGDRSADALVDAFLAEMGPKMGYTVAQDDAAGTITRDWLTAAYQGGIPASFIVDQQGRIAWIGHPAKGLDEALERVLAGSADLPAARTAYADEIARTLFHTKPYPAPEIKVAAWLRGTPIERFEPGQSYVVSVWSAGDPASESAFTHLAALSQRFAGKFIFLGVQINWARRKPDVEQVREYLTRHPELNFALATDFPDQTFRSAWMAPRKIVSLPSVFIVDGKGQVVWSGHPMVSQFTWALEHLAQRPQ